MEGEAIRGRDASIEGIEVAAYTIPTDSPEADGALAWSKTTIVLVEAKAGSESGIGYTYADAAAARLIRDLLTAVVGRDAPSIPLPGFPVRNLGRSNIASMRR